MSEKKIARRYNKDKLRYELLPSYALSKVVEVYTKGSEKYTLRDEKGRIIDDGSNNWRNGLSWMDMIASVQRHIEAWKQGEDEDIELKTNHLGNAIWGLLGIIEYYKIYPQGDDRLHLYLQDKRCALDLDGVLVNFTKGFVDLARKKGHILPEEKDYIQAHWNFPHSMTYLWEEIKSSKDFWLNLEPIEANRNFGFEPTLYISSRSIPVEWTTEWLEKNGFPNSKVIHTNGASKLDVLKENNIDIMVDDSWENFIDCNKGGICTYLMNASYNEKYSVGYKRIHSLKDLVI